MSTAYPALPISLEQIEFNNYCHARQEFSFETCKLNLGYDRAVAFEVEYQGVATLEGQSREALAQVNHILTALGRPVLLRWQTEPLFQCDACDVMVPRSHAKSSRLYSDEIEGDFCRKCRGMEDVEESDWTPVDEALSLPIFNSGDFWYCHFLRSSDAVQLATDYPCCDVVCLETERTMTANEANHRLEDPRYGEFEKFGVAFPEALNSFVTDFVAGLYPSLEAK